MRDAVDGEVKQLRVRFDRWQALLQNSNTTDVPFQVAHEGSRRGLPSCLPSPCCVYRLSLVFVNLSECGKDLRKTQDMVRKVKAAVTAVERNRVKYPHIDDRELASRKSFIGNLESVSACLFPTVRYDIICDAFWSGQS